MTKLEVEHITTGGEPVAPLARKVGDHLEPIISMPEITGLIVLYFEGDKIRLVCGAKDPDAAMVLSAAGEMTMDILSHMHVVEAVQNAKKTPTH